MLERYKEAMECLGNGSKDQEFKELVQLIETKMCHMEGQYDLIKLNDQYKIQGHLDIQDYFGPIRLDITPDDRGNGLFATRNIAQGELMVCEQSFVNSFTSDLDEEQQVI